MPLINYIGNRQEAIDNRLGGRGNAPSAPGLSVEYLVVGGGGVGGNPVVNGGCGGGLISGSLVIPFTSTTSINVGSGGISNPYTHGDSSSISSSTLGLFGAGGATTLKSGGPGYFDAGVDNGGGAGSSKDGNDGMGGNGDGGTGSVWLNGFYYAGGGGGGYGSSAPGLGGGGTALTGFGPDGLPYQLNGYNGRGGGASYYGTSGGSGVVIIRYSTGSLVPPYDNTISGGTLLISGGYAYHTFTGSGQFTYSF
jgi:hypothetical protein